MPKIELPEAFKNQDAGLSYSRVVKIDNHYHFSGVIPDQPIDPDIEIQTQQVLSKISEMLAKCGLTIDDIFGVTIMLNNTMADYTTVNKIYCEFMEGVAIKPRRKMFAAAALPFGVLIEIEVDAVKQE